MSNVNGISMTMTKGFKGVQLVADEWYPCVLKSITEGKATFKGVETDQLIWDFELIGDEFQMELKDGNVKQFSVWGKCAPFLSSKSKLFVWYTKLMGVEDIDEGVTLTTGDIAEQVVGMNCFIMVQPQTYKDKNTGADKVSYKVERVKPAPQEEQQEVVEAVKPVIQKPVVHVAKPIVKPLPVRTPLNNNNPGKVVTPDQIPSSDVGTSPVKKVFSKVDI